jgi:hypothetical protein
MKYSSEDTAKILQHWFSRQNKGLPPFMFSGEDYGKSQSTGKKKQPEWVDPDSDGKLVCFAKNFPDLLCQTTALSQVQLQSRKPWLGRPKSQERRPVGSNLWKKVCAYSSLVSFHKLRVQADVDSEENPEAEAMLSDVECEPLYIPVFKI